MNKIKCQACTPKDVGCAVCGGFKTIIFKTKCKCGRDYWMYPDATTMYNGKQHYSFDGLLLTYCNPKKSFCSYCKE